MKHSYRLILNNKKSVIKTYAGTYEQARKHYLGCVLNEGKVIEVRAISDNPINVKGGINISRIIE